ncbi:MAG TPA: hypothetical protein VLW85_24950 [Myxococcales bacterium]|nr:hypothetical protein [Myxococcales bacterium]
MIHSTLQDLLDAALRAPAWAGYALLALAVVITLPGRHGQRPLNGALLGGGLFALAFFGLRGVLHAWVPGIVAVVAGVVIAVVSIVEVGWSTAVVVGGIFTGIGAVAARHFGIPVWGLAPLAGGFGLLVGVVQHKRVSVIVPPLFASLFVALGAAISWAPHWRGAKLWQLNDVDWALGLWGVLAFVLLALSFEREYRKKLRLAARTKMMEDEELRKQLDRRREAYNKAFEKLRTLPPDDTRTH